MTRTFLAGLASALILTFPASAQTAAPQPEKLPYTFEIGGGPWPKSLAWQPAPSGAGEFLAFPHPAAGEPFSWRNQRFVGTPLGLLRAESPVAGKDRSGEQWNIVPAFYGRPARVVGASDGLLWVESQQQGVIALDENLTVSRRLPSVKGRCIAASARGFWCLDELGQDRDEMRAASLAEYDAAGTPKRRWIVEGLTLSSINPDAPREPGFRSFGGIAWVSVDADAVWMSLNDYHFGGIAGNDAPLTAGGETMGRLDRATGRFTPIEIPPAPIENGRPQVLGGRDWTDIGGRIAWLSRYSDPDVLQLDKKGGQVSRAFKLIAPGYTYSGIRIHGKYLWLINEGDPEGNSARVFSLRDYEEVKRRDAGAAPWGDNSRKPHFPAPGEPPWVGLLASSGTAAWLSGPDNSLLEVRDEGQPQRFDIGSRMRTPRPRYFPTVATEAALLWLGRENLVRLSTEGKLLSLPLSGLRNSQRQDHMLPFLAASPSRVWLQTETGPLTALSPDLHLLSTGASGISQLGSRRHAGTVAVGDVLYTWSEDGHLLRVDAATGQAERVESWSRRFPDGKPANGPNNPFFASPRREFAQRCDASFVLPAGRLAFRFAETFNRHAFSPISERKDTARLLIFDPIADTWKEAEGPATVDPIVVGAHVFGVDKERVYEWRQNRWQNIGPLPAPAREMPLSDEREAPEQKATLAGTQRYFYKETPLGLYRVAWNKTSMP